MSLNSLSAPASVGGRQSASLWWRIWQIVAMLYGPMVIGLLYLMWFSARLMLGRWPRWGGADDPKEIPVTWLIDLAVSLWLVLVPFVIVFAVVHVLQGFRRHAAQRPLSKGLIAAAGLVGLGLFVAANPHHLVTWYLD